MWPQIYATTTTVNAASFPSHQGQLCNVATISWPIRVALLEGGGLLYKWRVKHWHILFRMVIVP